jgi:hypothetical protein
MLDCPKQMNTWKFGSGSANALGAKESKPVTRSNANWVFMMMVSQIDLVDAARLKAATSYLCSTPRRESPNTPVWAATGGQTAAASDANPMTAVRLRARHPACSTDPTARCTYGPFHKYCNTAIDVE